MASKVVCPGCGGTKEIVIGYLDEGEPISDECSICDVDGFVDEVNLVPPLDTSEPEEDHEP